MIQINLTILLSLSIYKKQEPSLQLNPRGQIISICKSDTIAVGNCYQERTIHS